MTLAQMRAALAALLEKRNAERAEFRDLTKVETEYTPEQRARWDALVARFDDHAAWAEDAGIAELERNIARAEAILRDDDKPAATERAADGGTRPERRRQAREQNRSALVYAPPAEVREAALRAVAEDEDVPASVRESVDQRLRRMDMPDGRLARHILTTGHPDYRSAFGKIIGGADFALTEAERQAISSVRTMNITTDSLGGYAVPYVLDPTFINLDPNIGEFSMWRQLADVQAATSDNWHGITVTGITASMVGESEEVNESNATLAPVSIEIKKAASYVKYTYEAQQDVAGLEAEIRARFMRAKADLEDDEFTNGSGTGVHVHGIVTDLVAAGGSTVVASPTSNTLDALALYALEESLDDKFLTSAAFVANRKIYNKIRQLATTDGSLLWERIGAATPRQLIGYPTYNQQSMDGTYGSGENYVMILGDIKQAYRIKDRLGMTVVPVPVVLGNDGNRPTGEAGLYMYWRFGAGVVNARAAHILNVT